MSIFIQIEEISVQSNFFETGYLDVKNLNFYPEIRRICEGNTCRNYGASWACPPAIGTLEACKERVCKYDKMLLFSKRYELADSFDFDGMITGLRDFKDTVDTFNQHIKSVLSDYLLLSNEGCGRCSTCTYPNAPCRFPQSLHHSLEGYGFLVNELAQEAGVHYNNGPNSVTYFGALLFNARE